MKSINEIDLSPKPGNEHTVFMRRDCPVCISEEFEALNKVKVPLGSKSIVATLTVLDNDVLLQNNEISLSENAIVALRAKAGIYSRQVPS